MKRISIPEDWPVDEWYGFKRHHFEFEGCKAWIVEPDHIAGDGRWSWVTQWAEAYVPRVGVTLLLSQGFYHVHIDVFQYRCSPKGVGIMGRFHEKLVSMGLSPKVNLIGMSWGGLFSLRYAETFPERVCGIYLDAPVCDASENTPASADRFEAIKEQYGLSGEELAVSPLNPINNVGVITGIPVMAVVGQADQSVDVTTNFDVFEKRFLAAGGKLSVTRRQYWGHHPHGLDDPRPILDFHCGVREEE